MDFRLRVRLMWVVFVILFECLYDSVLRDFWVLLCIYYNKDILGI